MESPENQPRFRIPEREPIMTVYAGTNGAGKSELTLILQQRSPQSIVIDPDAIARRINPQRPEEASLQAGKEAIKMVKDCIQKGQDFSIETTLAGRNVLRQMDMAKAHGFQIQTYYVGLNSPDMHVERVAQRVRLGGHDIPEEDIRRRYETSQNNLPEAMRRSDKVFLLDNSNRYDVQLEVEKGIVRYQHPEASPWVQRAVEKMNEQLPQLQEDLKQQRAQISGQLQEVRGAMEEELKKLEHARRIGKLEERIGKLDQAIEEKMPSKIDQLLGRRPQQLDELIAERSALQVQVAAAGPKPPEIQLETSRSAVAEYGQGIERLVDRLNKNSQTSADLGVEIGRQALSKQFEGVRQLEMRAPSLEM